MSITLKPITKDNYETIIDLKVSDDQKHFVAPNMYSLAQAAYEKENIPLGIYLEDEAIGFIMYCMDEADQEYWIYRLMIDHKHQKKGYGKKAIEMVIQMIQEDHDHHMIRISFEPENAVAKALYVSLGFYSTGRFSDGEIIYQLDY